MKKNLKSVLTKNNQTATLRRMPTETPAAIRNKRSNIKQLKTKKSSAHERYLTYFAPAPSPLWQREDDNFSLDQPSPVKWVKTETTYGIDVTLCPLPNA